MEILLGLLALAAGIANLICFILVLVKLFSEKGALWGIFGFLCGIYTFIWGWQNAERFAIQQTMLIWTIGFVVSIIVNVFFSVVSS
jgi:hypothetical protein